MNPSANEMRHVSNRVEDADSAATVAIVGCVSFMRLVLGVDEDMEDMGRFCWGEKGEAEMPLPRLRFRLLGPRGA